MALFRILSLHHPMTSTHSHLLIQSPFTQLASETFAEYFQHYLDFINLQALLDQSKNDTGRLEMRSVGITDHIAILR